MANIVYMAKSAWTNLLDTIRSKASVSGTMTVSQATTAVENIETGGGGGDRLPDLLNRTISGTVRYNNVLWIPEYAFASCYYITDIEFQSATKIGSFAFSNCSSLTSVSLPNATIISNNAFAYCSRLSYIYAPNVTSIGNTAFWGDAFEDVNFPSAVSLGLQAFSSCKLKSAVFPAVTAMGSAVFSGCSSLSYAEFSAYNTMIPSYCFNLCSSLKTVSFPLASGIGSYAFSGCVSLEAANFEHVQSIYSSAFNYCLKLSTASFPKAVTIHQNAFLRCFHLLSLYLLGSSFVSLYSNAFVSTPIGGYTGSTGGIYGSVYVPASLYNQYISALRWSDISARIVSVAE